MESGEYAVKFTDDGGSTTIDGKISIKDHYGVLFVESYGSLLRAPVSFNLMLSYIKAVRACECNEFGKIWPDKHIEIWHGTKFILRRLVLFDLPDADSFVHELQVAIEKYERLSFPDKFCFWLQLTWQHLETPEGRTLNRLSMWLSGKTHKDQYRQYFDEFFTEFPSISQIHEFFDAVLFDCDLFQVILPAKVYDPHEFVTQDDLDYFANSHFRSSPRALVDVLSVYMNRPSTFSVSKITASAFLSFLFSDDNAVAPFASPIMRDNFFEVPEDLTLTDYYINTSHNTYLMGNQVMTKANVEAYICCLLMGCRCVEIDCWEAKEPTRIQVTHGYANVTGVPFRDVIKAIAKWAFFVSDYPLVLSLEEHTKLDDQDYMVSVMKTEFGPMLLTSCPESEVSTGQMPRLSALKNKILVKHKIGVVSTDSSLGVGILPEVVDAIPVKVKAPLQDAVWLDKQVRVSNGVVSIVDTFEGVTKQNEYENTRPTSKLNKLGHSLDRDGRSTFHGSFDDGADDDDDDYMHLETVGQFLEKSITEEDYFEQISMDDQTIKYFQEARRLALACNNSSREIVAQMIEGIFLVRNSIGSPGQYTLTIATSATATSGNTLTRVRSVPYSENSIPLTPSVSNASNGGVPSTTTPLLSIRIRAEEPSFGTKCFSLEDKNTVRQTFSSIQELISYYTTPSASTGQRPFIYLETPRAPMLGSDVRPSTQTACITEPLITFLRRMDSSKAHERELWFFEDFTPAHASAMSLAERGEFLVANRVNSQTVSVAKYPLKIVLQASSRQGSLPEKFLVTMFPMETGGHNNASGGTLTSKLSAQYNYFSVNGTSSTSGRGVFKAATVGELVEHFRTTPILRAKDGEYVYLGRGIDKQRMRDLQRQYGQMEENPYQSYLMPRSILTDAPASYVQQSIGSDEESKTNALFQCGNLAIALYDHKGATTDVNNNVSRKSGSLSSVPTEQLSFSRGDIISDVRTYHGSPIATGRLGKSEKAFPLTKVVSLSSVNSYKSKAFVEDQIRRIAQTNEFQISSRTLVRDVTSDWSSQSSPNPDASDLALRDRVVLKIHTASSPWKTQSTKTNRASFSESNLRDFENLDNQTLLEEVQPSFQLAFASQTDAAKFLGEVDSWVLKSFDEKRSKLGGTTPTTPQPLTVSHASEEMDALTVFFRGVKLSDVHKATADATAVFRCVVSQEESDQLVAAAAKICAKSPTPVNVKSENLSKIEASVLALHDIASTVMVRTYPYKMRFFSSNYDPCVFWGLGCQLVALNFQTSCRHMQTNVALFKAFSSNKGYVAKPKRMRKEKGGSKKNSVEIIRRGVAPPPVPPPLISNGAPSPTASSFRIRILAGRRLNVSTSGATSDIATTQQQSKSSNIKPFVIFETFGCCEKDKNTRKTFPAKSGFSPTWIASDSDSHVADFSIFEVEHTDTAFLRFSVFSNDKPKQEICQFTTPLACVLSGIRSVPLYNSSFVKTNDLLFSSLLVHIQVDRGLANFKTPLRSPDASPSPPIPLHKTVSTNVSSSLSIHSPNFSRPQRTPLSSSPSHQSRSSSNTSMKLRSSKSNDVTNKKR